MLRQQRWLAIWLVDWPAQDPDRPSSTGADHPPSDTSSASRLTLQRLADGLLVEISPLVAIEPLPSSGTWAGLRVRRPETLLVDITGIGDWFGGEPVVIEATRQYLRRHGCSARLAIADTSAAAWGLARFGSDPIVIVATGEHAATVERLPVVSLRLTHDVAYQLGRLGIETVGQLRRLPRSGLVARLGPELVRRIDQMFGRVAEPLAMHHIEPEDVAVCELEYPTTDSDILRHRIERLIDEVAARLASRVRGALRLVCRLDLLENEPSQRIEVGLFAPTDDAQHLKRLMVAAFEGRQLTALAERITVMVELAGPLRPVQTTLFDDSPVSARSHDRALARMIETVANRLGGDAVLGVTLTDHPSPEAAYRLRPLAGSSDHPWQRNRRRSGTTTRSKPLKSPRRSVAEPSPGPLPGDPLRRPLVLFDHPPAVMVERIDADGLPTRIRIGTQPAGRADRQTDGRAAARPPSGAAYRVLRCWGPERIETRGFDRGWQKRDYYRVEVDGGGWLWIYRQAIASDAAEWRLHGRFG